MVFALCWVAFIGACIFLGGLWITKLIDKPPYKAEKGYMWRKYNGEWRLVCDTCGGNCGQCGDTGKLGNIPFDLDYLVDKTGMNKPRRILK